MRLKTVLMASAAVVVGLAATGVAQADGVYGSFSGGLNWTDDPVNGTANGGSTNVTLSAEDGFIVALAVGWHLDEVITPGLRVELEGAYRHNNANGSYTAQTASGLNSSSSLGTDLVTWSVMANLWYDFDMGHSLRPYFGGGIGWARNKVVAELTAVPTVEAEGFAWQAGFGLNVAVSPAGSVGLGYRYMDSGEGPSTVGGFYLGDVTHSSVVFSLNYDLN
jgi:opacity protein-like surface antigen